MKLGILLIGSNGQLGRALTPLLTCLGEVTALDRRKLDLARPEAIRQVIRSLRPVLIVNAAAYTAVDRAESEETAARAVNAEAPRVMAEEAHKSGSIIIHYSTDYVFDGTKGKPYVEDDLPNPQNLYGKTKVAGEQAIAACAIPHLIFRTAWVYDRQGRNFLLTVLHLATQREELRIVQDQVGAPTWSRDIAMATAQIIRQACEQRHFRGFFDEFSGIYHMTAAGETSWYGFAKAILEQASHQRPCGTWFAEATGGRPLIARRVIPITTNEYPAPARRPAYSILSNARLLRTFRVQLSDWQAQLTRVFADDAI
jgi:dTDP-4-dehydrorhamnose reductase